MLNLTISSIEKIPSTHLRFTLKNVIDKTIRFLPWNTVFDTHCPQGLLIEAESLPIAVYRGARGKYHFDPHESLINLEPGDQIESIVDVSTHYRIPASSSFHVTLSQELIGIVGDLPDNLLSCNLTAIELRLQSSEFELTPIDTTGLFPAAFASEVSNQQDCMPPLCWKSYYVQPVKCVLGRARYAHAKIVGGSAVQQEIVRKAIDRLYQSMTITGRGRLAVKDDPNYRRWFGVYSIERSDLVRKSIRGIIGQAVCKSFVIYIRSKCENNGMIAFFQKPNSDDQYGMLGLCPLYFKENETGLNSLSGTIAHEISHGYSDTIDPAYGVESCLKLARNNPDSAVRNADSIQYYLEEVVM